MRRSSATRSSTSDLTVYESEVTDFVASQTLCMHAIAIEAWASGWF